MLFQSSLLAPKVVPNNEKPVNHPNFSIIIQNFAVISKLSQELNADEMNNPIQKIPKNSV
jgi:hypothetical protein